ncbi:MAG: intein-containing DNA gyrase subunit A, partial [Candidatus Latescibacteria bacterium]|nr:intein-containing DNA gyrase subunit A [Candidatus Latescibacterota bacterium]
MLIQRQRIVPIHIEEEMQKSYLDFSFSTIMDRALPDVRDGLKPSQRRILVAMHDLGLDPSSQHRKCAKIAGNTSGDYHPHGEGVVYPTLVRMAQDFNMRYPLVDGQGNFGCFTGDTCVRLADGTSRSFEELVKDYAAGRTHFTYTVNKGGRIEMAPILAPRLTHQDAPIVCVILDNGERIRCTPDHRFMLRDGTYGQAQDLRMGDSLMPLYTRLYGGEDTALRGYEEIYQLATDEWQFVHHLADEYNLRVGIYERSAGRVR